jgi:hypothetical protein
MTPEAESTDRARVFDRFLIHRAVRTAFENQELRTGNGLRDRLVAIERDFVVLAGRDQGRHAALSRSLRFPSACLH